MRFNQDKPKHITRYIPSMFYVDMNNFCVKQNLFIKNKDKKDGEISFICIDGLFQLLDPYQEQVFIYGDNLLYKDGSKKVIARADIKVQDLKKIKLETDDVLKLEYTKARHYNLVSRPDSSKLFDLYVAKKLASISELNLRKDYSKYIEYNKYSKQINTKAENK